MRVLFRTLILTSLVLSACSSPHYKIVMRDNRELLAANRPEYVSKTGYYRYRAINGKDALVRADEVLMLQEQ